MSILGRLFGKGKTATAQAKAPDPKFLGDFMVAQMFPDMRFQISEAKFAEFAKDVPTEIRGLVTIWSLFYLMWLMRVVARLQHGTQFESDMMRYGLERLANAPKEVPSLDFLSEGIEHWFKQFDEVALEGPKTVQGQEIPVEIFLSRCDSCGWPQAARTT